MLLRSKGRPVQFLLVTFLLFLGSLQISAQPSPGSSPLETQRLQEEKLRQETIKLQLENQKSASFWNQLLSYSTLITGLVAVGGLIATFWKQIAESARQRDLDRNQRESDRQQQERDRQQREDERLQRLEEKFTTIVSNLGSKSASIQASAAVSIMNFLKPEHNQFHHQVFLILLANLKLQHNDNLKNKTLSGLLVSAFQESIRTQRPPADVSTNQPAIDLSRTCLNRIDLSKLNLVGADVAFSELESANLTESNLSRVRGYEVHLEKARLSRAKAGEARLRKAFLSEAQFHEANLVSADLKETDLRQAQFQKAKLQSAHFEGANLTGAKFEQADINDAFFQNAILTPETLKSILNSFNWQNAHFDDPVKATLKALSEADGKRMKDGGKPVKEGPAV